MLTINKKNHWISDLFFLILGIGIFYALWMGSYALFTPDEGRYSEVAREMIVTGDYITPRLNGVVFLDKPILYYWLQASAIYWFGLKEWALRFWPVCIGILGCLMTYVAGRLLFNRRAGLISAVVLATSPLYYGAAHYANLDLEVASFIACSLLCFIVAMQRFSLSFLVASYVFAGLAALTKGLIGLAFPAMIIFTWMVVMQRWETVKQMRLISGLLLFVAITLPWYYLVQKANPEFFDFFFMKQQVSRFLTTEYFNNRTPGWFYFPVVLGGLFPWCVFILLALGQTLKSLWQNRKNHSTEAFLLIWIIIIFLFFSIPKSKTLGYILPIFPALALLLGQYINFYCDRLIKRFDAALIVFFILSLGISLSCFILPHTSYFDSPELSPYLLFNAILFSVTSIISGSFILLKSSSVRVFSLIATTSVIFLLTIAASGSVLNQKTIKPLAIQIKPALEQNDEIVAFYKYYQDLPIYLEKRITIVADWKAKDIPFYDNWVRELWYGMPYQSTQDWLIGEATFWQRWNSAKRLWVFTDMNYLPALQKKSVKPVYEIAKYNRTVLISNQPKV